MSRRVRLILCLVAGALPAPAADAQVRVTAVSASDRSVAAGARFPASATLLAPRPVRVRFALTAGARRISVGVGRAVAEPGRRRRTATARLRVPRTLAPGSYGLIVCSAGARCRALPGRIGVRARPDPASISIDAETADAGVQRIGSAGGSAFAFSPDGTVFTLVIPPGALDAPVPISISPLRAAARLPFSGGLVAGVKLEPDGVELNVPATLLIRREGLTAEADQRVLGFERDGTQTYLSVFARDVSTVQHLMDESTLAVPVRHFSGVLVARGTQAETAAQAGRTPADPFDGAHQTIAESRSAARACELTTGDCGTQATEDAAEALDDLQEQVVDPELAAATQGTTDLDRTSEAVRNALALERERDLNGFGSEGNIYEKIGEAIERASARARKLCFDGDVRYAVDLLALDRQYQLVSGERGLGAIDSLRRCLRFEVRISSLIAHDGNGGEIPDHHYELDATVPLAGSLNGLIEGTGPFVHRRYSYSATGPHCTFEGTRTVDSTYYVQLHTPVSRTDGTYTPETRIRGTDRHLALTVDPGDPAEFVRVTCTVDGRTSTDERQVSSWSYWWKDRLHRRDQIGSPTDASSGLWFINEFEPGRRTSRGTMLARKVIATDEPYGNGTQTVRELWEVIHTPGGSG